MLNACDFNISEIAFKEQEEWTLNDHSLSHRTGGFFHVLGGVYSKKENLYLHQPQGAFNGLLVCKKENQIWILLHARVEPGNTGIVQYGPTMQSTPANYLRLHGGKKTPYIEYFFDFVPNTRLLSNSTQLDLGESYLHKTKTLHYVEVPTLLECAENMQWFTLDEILNENFTDYFYNTDLRSMLGVFDWSRYKNEKEYVNHTVKNVPSRHSSSQHRVKIKPIKDLQSFRTLEDKIISEDGQSGVQMCEVSCLGREVKNWYQPLIFYSNKSYFDLIFKVQDEKYYFLLSISKEPGVGEITTTSFAHYFEENEPTLEGASIKKTINQSEEGGRFFQSNSVYRIFQGRNEIEIGKNQFWVDKIEMKALLATSNCLSIQLRSMMSFFIPELNSR